MPAGGPPPPAPNPYAYPPPAYGYTPYGGPQSNYAGFGARLGALILDSLIVGIPGGVVVLGSFFALAKNGVCRDQFSDFSSPTGSSYSTVSCKTLTGGSAGIFFLVAIVVSVLTFAYYVVSTGRRGQTIGKRIVGIKVVDIQSGQPIGVPRALGRQFMQIISGSICYLGYLWMLWDDRSQTWHDKVVDSIVVKA